MKPRHGVLRRLDHLYNGEDFGGGSPETQAALSLKALGNELDIPIRPPPREVVVLVVGDAGTGKSAFVNALVKELILPVGSLQPHQHRPRPPVEWIRSDIGAAGALPRLLQEVAQQFPGWPMTASGGVAACCSACCVNAQVDGIEFVEATPQREAADAEPLLWLAARVDVIICLLDSQQQPAASDGLLQWLKKLPCLAGQVSAAEAQPTLQFVLSKADLVTRESDRIRLLAKASRLLTDRLGRGFEILPTAAGDLDALLDALPAAAAGSGGGGAAPRAAVVGARGTSAAGGPQPLLHEATTRALRVAREHVARREAEGLEALLADGAALAGALEARLAEARRGGGRQRGPEVSDGGSSFSVLRPKLFQCSGAMLLVAAAAPLFLDEDIEPWVAQACAGSAAALAVLLGLLAAALPAGSCSHAAGTVAERRSALLAEQGRFVGLALQQCRRWSDVQPQKELPCLEPSPSMVTTTTAAQGFPSSGPACGNDSVSKAAV
mmetsp:Transcript_101706/g.283175  ORF Transcript_101706/g.283175 Transcript_101706/m.283175 type:complete len:496 (+) Transcript_101706:60-1547(+)